MGIIDVGIPLLDLGEVADQAAVPVDGFFQVLIKGVIGVVIADGNVSTGEIFGPAREEERGEVGVH
jgi:hypothetical protein